MDIQFMKDYYDLRYEETGWGIVDIHWNDELFHEGSNTVKFEISFGYAKNDGTIVKQSKSVEITVNFTVQ